MTCECMRWYAQIDDAFDNVRELNDVGRILGQESVRSLFQQAVLVMKSSVPFTRPSFYLMTGGGRQRSIKVVTEDSLGLSELRAEASLQRM